MNLGDRITALRMRRGWSQNQLAERADMDRSHLSKLVRGKYENPGHDTLRKIAGALGVPLSEITGEQPISGRQATVIEGVVAVPIVRVIVQASGQPDYGETDDTVATTSTGDVRRDRRLKAAIVAGSCMAPNVLPGDRVIFDPGWRDPVDGQMVVIVDAEGITLVKWFRRDDDGQAYLRANDGSILHPNGARIIGTVVDIIRRPGRDPQSG